MAKQYNYNTCTRAKSEALQPAGMSREAVRKAVQKKLTLGQQYRLKSVNTTRGDTPKPVVCELMQINNNMAIFKHKNGMLETFTYQELWKQMTDGDFI